MKVTFYILSALSLLSLLAVPWSCLDPGDNSALEPGGESWPGFEDLTRSARENHRDVQTRLEAAQYRTAAKRGVAAEVTAGRLTLLEAAARFRDLNEAPPDSSRYFMNYHAADAYAEHLCREVILYAEAVLVVQSPEEAACVAAYLNAELQDQLDRHGALHLPRGR
jgi:hypothetical protein